MRLVAATAVAAIALSGAGAGAADAPVRPACGRQLRHAAAGTCPGAGHDLPRMRRRCGARCLAARPLGRASCSPSPTARPTTRRAPTSRRSSTASSASTGPLTPSGVYYLAFTYPPSVYSPPVYTLHVADGSEIITRRVGDGEPRRRRRPRASTTSAACTAWLTPGDARRRLPADPRDRLRRPQRRPVPAGVLPGAAGHDDAAGRLRQGRGRRDRACRTAPSWPFRPKLAPRRSRRATVTGSRRLRARRLIVSAGGRYDGTRSGSSCRQADRDLLRGVGVEPSHAFDRHDRPTRRAYDAARPVSRVSGSGASRPRARRSPSGGARPERHARDADPADGAYLALQPRQPVRGALVRRGHVQRRGDVRVRLGEVAAVDRPLLAHPAPSALHVVARRRAASLPGDDLPADPRTARCSSRARRR